MPDTTDDSAMQRGLAAADADNFEVAEAEFEQAVADDPTNARARYNLALAKQNLGDPEGAIMSYLRALRLDPKFVEAHINLGNLYGELGLEQEALDSMQHAIELEPDNANLYITIADSYRDLGLYDEAIEAYHNAIRLNPDNTLAQDSLDDVRERQREQTEMIDDLKANLDKDPADLTRYSDLVDAYLEAHRYEDADKMVQKMVALEPSNPTTFETKAVYHETMGDIDAAADAWQKVTELEPNDSEAWEHLGTWREEQGRIEDAISAYRNAVKADPQTEGLQFSLAEILAEGEHYDEAAAIYVALVERHKDARNEQDEEVLADAYTGLASTLNIKGDYQEALKIATDYAQRFPDQPEAAYERASALSALGRHEEAVEAYELAIDGDPLNANAHADLAESYLAIGKKDKALEAAETAISLDPESPAAHETLAHAYVANGRQADAEAALAKAASLQADLDE